MERPCIDVRQDDEFKTAHSRGVKYMGRDLLDRAIVQTILSKSAELILYCDGGHRTAVAADMVQRIGYSNIRSLTGSWAAWQEDGAPIETAIF
ncbi:MAG: hypothetical protein IPG67_05230 [Acidobacteria bacterium]|nr:hypothetical protein [Acidobacteriota bacterium]